MFYPAVSTTNRYQKIDRVYRDNCLFGQIGLLTGEV